MTQAPPPTTHQQQQQHGHVLIMDEEEERKSKLQAGKDAVSLLIQSENVSVMLPGVVTGLPEEEKEKKAEARQFATS